MEFIAFDLETTGFLPGVDQIIEIGAVKFINGRIDSVFSTLVDPERPIPPGATKVNGITYDMVSGKPKILELLEPFSEFCGDRVIVAHNANFDAQFLSADIKKFESPAPNGIILDTLGMARKVLPGLPNYKLGTLVKHLGIPETSYHRAEEDAGYCGKLFVHILNKVSTGGSVPDIDNLISLTGKPKLLFPQIASGPKQLGLF